MLGVGSKQFPREVWSFTEKQWEREGT